MSATQTDTLTEAGILQAMTALIHHPTDTEQSAGKGAWWRLSDLLGHIDQIDRHAQCEAPRHLGQQLPAVYVWVLIIYAETTAYVQGMCTECMDRVATTLGTTAEADAKEWHK